MAEDNGMALGYALGQDSGGGGGGGFGGSFGEGLWAVIILAILFGRGGFGGGFGGGGNSDGNCATQADVRAAVDQQTLISKLDQQTYGLADSTYALNNTIVNGFHGVDNAVCTLGYNMQNGFNTLGYQMKDCCCETQRMIERGFCDVGQAISMQTRDIIDNQNANYRGIMDFMVNSKIEALRSENEALRLSASQAKQNQYLIDQLRPCPVPAYITCNPYAASWGTGYNNGGCGCA
ncbi:MAG: hypothetical protein J6U82_06710 [Alistipes sp.]|nr:hypothetical protein [Alistipes sp.]